ncbi:hypothetical protein [Streptomyces variabilis]
MSREQTPEQKVTALALAALRFDGPGLVVLLADLPDDEVRTACGFALQAICEGFHSILNDDAWRAVVASAQAHAASLAHDS